MTRRCPNWLSGAMIVTSVADGLKKGFKVELFLRLLGTATVVARCLDRYRFEVSGKGGTCPVRVELETSESAEAGSGCLLLGRAREVLGGAKLYRSTCEIWLPEHVLPETAFIGFSIRQPGFVSRKLVNGADEPWERSPDCIYLEAKRQTLGIGKQGVRSLYFLSTRQQSNDRIEVIGNKFDLFRRDDEASTDATTKLYLGVISGEDGPILTEWLEDGTEGMGDDDEDDVDHEQNQTEGDADDEPKQSEDDEDQGDDDEDRAGEEEAA